MKILSFDMGFRNTAWALAENDKIITYGMLENPVSGLININLQRRYFLKEYETLTRGLKRDDAIVAERFSVRGFNPGAQVELVSFMLGMMTAAAPVRMYLIMAATWKNYIASNYTGIMEENKKIKIFNKGKAKKRQKPKLKFEMEEFLDGSKYAEHEHICDAIGIGQWFYEKETETDSKFLKKWSEK